MYGTVTLPWRPMRRGQRLAAGGRCRRACQARAAAKLVWSGLEVRGRIRPRTTSSPPAAPSLMPERPSGQKTRQRPPAGRRRGRPGTARPPPPLPCVDKGAPQGLGQQDGNRIPHVGRVVHHVRRAEHVVVGKRLEGRGFPHGHAAVLLGVGKPAVAYAVASARQRGRGAIPPHAPVHVAVPVVPVVAPQGHAAHIPPGSAVRGGAPHPLHVFSESPPAQWFGTAACDPPCSTGGYDAMASCTVLCLARPAPCVSTGMRTGRVLEARRT